MINAILKLIEWWVESWRRGAGRKRVELKAKVLMSMRRAESGKPAPLLFSTEAIAKIVGLGVPELIPILDELEREGRIFWSSFGEYYSLHPMPWARPQGSTGGTGTPDGP